MHSLIQDVRLAVRSALKRPLFTFVAAGSVAVGVGATTSLLSVVEVLMLRPVPGVPGVERAVELGRGTRGSGFDTFSYPEIEDIRAEVGALDRVAAVRPAHFSVTTSGGGRRVEGAFVSAAYFEALGVEPARGRLFGPDERVEAGPAPVVVISDLLAREEFGGVDEALGRTLEVNRRSFTVVGVVPPDFRGHFAAVPVALYLPVSNYPALASGVEGLFERRESSWTQAIGRLSPGATVEQANAEVQALFEALRERHPRSNRDRTATVVPLGPVPGGGRTAVLAFVGSLMAMVVLVLMVTCSNVACMFLARASSRRREIAVRMALGSSRSRLVRHLLVESLVVFALGGFLGVVLADWGMALLDLGALPVPVELSLDLRPAGTVLAAGLLVTLVCGLVFGLAPALQAVGSDLLTGLKVDTRGSGRSSSVLRRGFAGIQVAFSLVLLVSAGLFLRSLQRAGTVDTGFDPFDAYVTSLDLEVEGYGVEEGRSFVRHVLEQLEAAPGVGAAAASTDLPLDMGSRGTGIRLGDSEEVIGVHFNQITPGYLDALGLRLVRGRNFTEEDRTGAEEVAIVSRSFVDAVFPDRDPLGRRFDFLLEGQPTVTVVGVVDDVKNQTLMEAGEPFVYRPLDQQYGSAIQFAVRSDRSEPEVAAALHGAILAVDPSVALAPVVAVDRLTSVGLLPQAIGAAVAGALGLVALLLAGLGLYGVVAFLVARSTREIGIRMALGADRSRVLGRVVASGFGLALPGLLLGTPVAFLLGHLLAGQNVLLGLSPADPLTIGGVALVLLVVVLVASVVPATRATRIEPSRALRAE